MKSILIIDDEYTNRLLYREFLKNSGYRVLIGRDGLEGLQMACEYRPDLIILDLMLPKIDGCDLYNMFREDVITKDIPILIISAHVSPVTVRKRCPGIPREYVFQKPINHREINELIDQILKNHAVTANGH